MSLSETLRNYGDALLIGNTGSDVLGQMATQVGCLVERLRILSEGLVRARPLSIAPLVHDGVIV